MIRPVTDADADEAASLIRTAFAALEIELEPSPSALRVTGDDIRAHLAAGGGGAWHGGEGVLLWHERDGGLYLGRLAVSPRSRGKGIASALLEHAEEAARTKSLPFLHLGVRLALDGNRRLFRRAGFIEGARHRHAGYDHDTFVDARKQIVPRGTIIKHS